MNNIRLGVHFLTLSEEVILAEERTTEEEKAHIIEGSLELRIYYSF